MIFKPGKSIKILGFYIGRNLKREFGILKPEWFRGFLQLFTYRILIYRKHAPHLERACKIGYNGKYLYLLDKQNEVMPAQINLTIIERLNMPTRAKVELFVNITEFIKIEDR